ncbi:hypothetical protein BDQ12DRAFT_762592 [Crucibulum laeve]|uniref:Uncharacterized protein n=1 Tax=Crucibulum laeve TaxID=68775 RepID=A0A5C3MBJ1_9AGAR|nr:hypothetical protein BDQ12DRAFT_762592 [Crucibulum laeve]
MSLFISLSSSFFICVYLALLFLSVDMRDLNISVLDILGNPRNYVIGHLKPVKDLDADYEFRRPLNDPDANIMQPLHPRSLSSLPLSSSASITPSTSTMTFTITTIPPFITEYSTITVVSTSTPTAIQPQVVSTISVRLDSYTLGIIIGCSVGGVLIITIAVLSIIYFRRRRIALIKRHIPPSSTPYVVNPSWARPARANFIPEDAPSSSNIQLIERRAEP